MTIKDPMLGVAASLLGFLMVAGGAFGAHGLEGQIPATDLAAFETGMRYGLIHSLAALLALVFHAQGLTQARKVGWFFIVGTVFFSGSLGFLGLSGSRALVLVTPLGGLCFLIGWTLLGLGFFQHARR
jgi:uncharacterized membrane protein YgdD (TMEM256/DUF423 family)